MVLSRRPYRLGEALDGGDAGKASHSHNCRSHGREQGAACSGGQGPRGSLAGAMVTGLGRSLDSECPRKAAEGQYSGKGHSPQLPCQEAASVCVWWSRRESKWERGDLWGGCPGDSEGWPRGGEERRGLGGRQGRTGQDRHMLGFRP